MTNGTSLIGTSDTQTYARHSSSVLMATGMQATASTSAVHRLFVVEHIMWYHHLLGLRLVYLLITVISLTYVQLL
jgi:hypothetical protein